MYITKDFIKSNWIINKQYAINNFVISGKYYDIDKVLQCIFSFIEDHYLNNDYSIAVNEDFVSSYLKNHKKQTSGLSSAEQVARKSGGFSRQSKSGKSFYDKNNKIGIELEDGTVVEGIIRISDHDFDINKWIENNDESFGVSFVINEYDADTVETGQVYNTGERSITVYEYTYKINRNNIAALNLLALQITNIKNAKHYKAGVPIYGVVPNIRKSVLEKKILKAVGIGLQKVFD